MANEKLTMQALIEHDRVQPKLKATGTSNSSTVIKENASIKSGDAVPKRRRNPSSSDTKSQKSVSLAPPKTGINFFRIVAATKAWQRLAKQRAAKRSPKLTPKCENTYRLEPAEGQHFSPQKVELVMKNVIENHPGLDQYNHIRSKLLVRDLSEKINEKVKELDFPRYKLVCNVIIMEKKDQGNASIKSGDAVPKRRRNPSSSDTKSQKSVSLAPPKTGINFFRIVAATKAWQRLAKQRAAKRSPKLTPKCENTYRLEPAEGQHFSPQKVELVMKNVIENHPGLDQYNHIRSKLLVRDLSEKINEKVKELDFPRYKLVCNVIIMEKKDQGVNIASRCIWNQQTDNFASYTYKNGAAIVVAYVHGVYLE